MTTHDSIEYKKLRSGDSYTVHYDSGSIAENETIAVSVENPPDSGKIFIIKTAQGGCNTASKIQFHRDPDISSGEEITVNDNDLIGCCDESVMVRTSNPDISNANAVYTQRIGTVDDPPGNEYATFGGETARDKFALPPGSSAAIEIENISAEEGHPWIMFRYYEVNE